MAVSRSLERSLLLAGAYALATAAGVAGVWLIDLSPLAPWVLLAGAGMCYLVLVRPDLFVLVLIAILPWQGALQYPTEDLTVVKIVGVLLLVSVLLSTLLTDRRLRLTPVLGAALLLCVAVTASLLVNGLTALSASETLRYWSLTLFAFLIVQLIDSRASFMRAIRVLALSAMVGAAWASVQFLDGSVVRASGPLGDPNEFAYFLAAVLPFLAYLFAVERNRRWLWGVGLLSLTLAILGASSRGAFVALGVTLVWAIFTRRIAPRIVAAAIAIAATAAFLALAVSSATTAQNLQIRSNGLSMSVNERKAYWSAAERIALDHPLFGVGPANFRTVGPRYIRDAPALEELPAVNNSYLSMLSENGAIATLVFALFLGLVWLQTIEVTRPPEGVLLGPRAPELWLRSTFQAAFLVALVGGIFFSAQLNTPFWFIAAFVSALSLKSREPPDESGGDGREEGPPPGPAGRPPVDKVALFVPTLEAGGAERATLVLAGGLRERGWDVDIVACRHTGVLQEDVPPGVRTVSLGAPGVALGVPSLRAYIQRERPTAVLSALAHANLAAIAAVRTMRRPRARVVVVEHSHLTTSTSMAGAGLKERAMPRFVRLLYRHADAIAAVSSGVALDLAQRAAMSPPEIEVIGNPIDFDRIRRGAAATIEHPWLSDPTVPVVVAVGRLTPAKDFPTLLRAVALVRREIPVHTLILGEGPARNELQRLIGQLELSACVALNGYTPNPYPFVDRAQLFVLSSRWEGLPTALIEAAALGTPVVSTDCPSGPREIFGDAGDRLVPPGDSRGLADAMLDALRDPDRHRLDLDPQRFRLDAVLDRYEALLR
jgi:glycosyltransferase involved in cell wall biosynthesis/O-antigen ligase